ncbi:MAG TPA: alpha/beta fold hydrolase [Pseudonocardia sp.]|uniref:alpha/beta hydrolase n=1 Tax=Pseudonocardia sp. TaxID=60912 RepID=UPI002CC9AAAE|nr:alpha/beta fold hydrolase [Pseudonocardia sp.]HTF54004.1 alpha/beta fold hydrolase [Pseudonocardia sp.]
MTSPRTPVVFIHGLWLHATSWAPWIELFDDAGYQPIAPGWPGDADTVEQTRANPDALARHGIDDIVEHYTSIIASLATPPILIGHSFGGTVAEKLLGRNLGVAAVAIDAAQIKGVLPVPIAALRSAFPVLKNPANLHRAVALTAEQFRYGFGNALPAEESDLLHQRWSIPGPGKTLFEAAVTNLDPHSPLKVDTANPDRGPLLLVMGGKDHTVPEAISKATLKQYRHSTAITDLEEFSDRGHSLTIDHGWHDVAALALKWLKEQGH